MKNIFSRLLPFVLAIVTEVLKENQDGKLVEFLTDEKTQNTVQDFYEAYVLTVKQLGK